MAVLGIVGTVLFTILKIVLIVLLLVLAIALLVLFVPVRYGIWLEKEEKFSARVRVSWLCRLVSFRVLYGQGQGEPEFTLRVFGFNLFAWLQGRREKAGREAGEEAGAVQDGTEESDISIAELELPGHEEPEYEEPEHEEPRHGEPGHEEPGHEEDGGAREGIGDEKLTGEGTAGKNFEWEDKADDHPFAEADEDFQEKKSGFFHTVAERVRGLWQEALRRLRGIADFFKGLRKIARKLRKRAEWLGEVKDFWRSENTRQMVCIFRDNVLHLWRKLKPRTVKGQVRFGTGDPSSTGQVLGACAMLFAYYGNGIAITPDFERQVLEGKLIVKGHLSLVTAVVILVKVFFSRQWKTFRREWNVIGGSINE